jgi:hypothetical protein
MSLIIATSRLNEDETQSTNQRPSNFQNFFRSPIQIEPDSEIAVDSVKIQRTGNITIGAKAHFCHYFGLNPDVLGVDNEYNELLSISRTIKPKKGTYSIESYAEQLTKDFNNQYDDPRIYGNASVIVNPNAAFQEEGVQIIFTDRGKSSTDVSGSLVEQAVFNLANPSNFRKGQQTPGNDAIKPSDAFTWNSGTGVFSRTGNPATGFHNASCVGMLTGRPFCLNQGTFDFTIGSANGAPFCVGLSRPQIQFEDPTRESTNASSTTKEKTQRYRGIYNLDNNTWANKYNNTGILSYDGATSIRGPSETYDYVFIQDGNDDITIAHRVAQQGAGGDGLVSRHQELEYWNSGGSVTGSKMTKTAFGASYDGVRFEGLGDQMNLYFKQKGKSVYDQILGSNLSSAGAVGRTFNPIGSTSYALYPMINLGIGAITVTDYDSNYTGTDNSYDSPTYVASPLSAAGYYPGDDMFSNEAVDGLSAEDFIHLKADRQLASDSLQSAVFKCDGSYLKLNSQQAGAYGPFVFAGMNAAAGVDYGHIITMNKFSADPLDTLIAGQKYPNMSGRLGFPDRAIINSKSGVGYVAGDDSKVITFTSVFALEKTALSSFIRLPGLTHKSFNGAQAGLSKIIYQLPQFSNDGREFGALYFEPGEKTYIKLNNPNPLLLNSLQVQIVDPFEKETNSLTGDTQIVFHIRKSK